jgi:hypothetical protein
MPEKNESLILLDPANEANQSDQWWKEIGEGMLLIGLDKWEETHAPATHDQR